MINECNLFWLLAPNVWIMYVCEHQTSNTNLTDNEAHLDTRAARHLYIYINAEHRVSADRIIFKIMERKIKTTKQRKLHVRTTYETCELWMVSIQHWALNMHGMNPRTSVHQTNQQILNVFCFLCFAFVIANIKIEENYQRIDWNFVHWVISDYLI